MNGSQALEQARQALTHGRADLAERIAQRYLKADPGSADGWRLVAEAREAQGKRDEALAAYEHLVRLSPDSPGPRHELASALARVGGRGDALALFREVLARWPEHAESHVQLGILLAESGQIESALTHLRRAVELRPDHAQARHNLGVALAEAGRTEEATGQIREALRLEPNYAEAAYNLGNVLADAGGRDEALECYRQALALRPGHYGALNNLGMRLREAGKPGEAATLLAQAVRLRPELPDAANNLGLALTDLGRFEEAVAVYRETLARRPDHAEAHVNLGSALKEMGRSEEAIACYDLALWLEPGSRTARYNRALTRLQAGDWTRGWPEYEARWGRKTASERTFPQPRWDGSSLEGKTVLLWCEQGLGDAVQFVRYAQALKGRGARVLVECPNILVALMQRCAGIDRVVAEGEALPEYDAQVPLMSLPGLLGVTPARDAVSGPYLSAEPERVRAWRERLGPTPGLRVAVVWQGNPYFQWDGWRSVPLAAMGPLAQAEGVELISLQKEHGLEQLDAAAGRLGVRRLSGLDDEGGAFADTAAVLCCVDVLVSADTAVGHVAGALGVPCWLALSQVCDWRWLRDRESTVWYGGHRLFRQRRLGDWEDVFARMAGELAKWAEAKRRRGLVRLDVSAGEWLDRLSIARLKAQRIADPGKRLGVLAELEAVQRAGARLKLDAEAEGLAARLAEVNGRLWEVEDELRVCEAAQDFGGRFVELARSVYALNDERGALKRALSERLGAPWAEQKQYGSKPDV